MKNLLVLFLLVVLCSAAFAQDKVSVGDEVEYKCNCFGQVWVRATVEGVKGNAIKVRFGNLDNQVATVGADSGMIRTLPKPESQETIRIRNAFRTAAGKYVRSVGMFAQFQDPSINAGGYPIRPEEWQKVMQDLAELDSVCQGFPGVTNEKTFQPGMIDEQYAVWCQVAANRTRLEKAARGYAGKQQVTPGITVENLNFGFNEPDNPVRMETQQLIWDRAKWRAAAAPIYKPRFAQFGTEMPADFFEPYEKRADELKAIVERDAPSRSWKQPRNHDPAVESFMKAKFAAQYPGSTVLKIGLDYATWVQRKSLTYVGSDETFNYYNVSYNSYKRGSVLLKMPNRPFCQAQDWVVGRGGKGLVAVAVGGSGTFMKCE